MAKEVVLKHPSPLQIGPWSAFIRVLCVLGTALMWFTPLALALEPQWLLGAGLGESTGLHWRIETPAQRLRAVLVSLLPAMAGQYALWHLWRLIGRYAQGDVFGPPAMAALDRFARGLLALVLAQIAARTLMSVALTWDYPPGQRVLSVGLGSNDYMLLLFAAVLVAITRVMHHAASIAEDNAGFI
jgi:Protein of unknown function (DUF2975)